jgi:hypothetical protein
VPEPGRKRWVIAAAIALLAVGAVAAYRVLPFGGSKSTEATAPAAEAPAASPASTSEPAATGDTGELRIETVPTGARVTLDGREVGFTPLTLKAVSVGRHALILQGDSGTVRRTVRVQAGERTVARYEITAGFLSLSSRIPLEIYEGTRKLGTSDGGHLLLAPGSYKLRLVNTRYGFEDVVDVNVRPGEVTTQPVTLPEGSLLVTTEPGSEIFVEGQLAGTAPLGALQVPIGSREIRVRHPRFGERREAVDIRQGKRVELSVVFQEGAQTRPNTQTKPRLAPLSREPSRQPLAR